MKWTKAMFNAVIKAVEQNKSRAWVASNITGDNVQTAREMIQAVKNREVICSNNPEIISEIKTKQQLKSVKKELADTRKELVRVHRQLELNSELSHSELELPKWTVTPSKKSRDKTVMCTILSDTHFDEVVHPEEVNYCNEYSRTIATKRLQQYFENLILLDEKYISGVKAEGLMIAMAGDIVAGNIHEELTMTNDGTIIETIIYWSEQLICGLKMVLDHFKNIWVNCVVGNHGRTSPKLTFKRAVTENWDYLLYRMIAKEFDSVPDITFNIPLSTQTIFDVYDVTYGLHHGMDFRGGFGDAGAVIPIIRGNRRKKEFQSNIRQPYDVLLMGHFHQLMRLPSVIVNGSMVGYNEYAMRGSFPFEQPQQACWLTDPKRGAQQPFFPIFCDCSNGKRA